MVYKVINNGLTAELKFYGIISAWWNGADDYTRTLAEIEAKGIKNVIVRTHCYGGSVLEGFAIWTANKSSKLNIEFIIDGIAASMMAIVMLSGKKVTMSSVAKVMVHAPRDSQGGISKQLFETAKLLKSMEKDFVNVWTAKTKQTPTEAAVYMDGTDYWLDAEECRKLGIADAILEETVFITDVAGKPDNGTPVENIYNRYTAVASQEFPHNKKSQTMDKKAIIAQFKLTGVDENSSETAIMNAIEVKNTADIATAKAGTFEATATALIEAKEAAMNTKFTEVQKVAFKALANSDAGIESLKTVLAAMQPVPNITSMLDKEGKALGGSPVAADRASWSWDKWEKEDPAGLEALEDTNIEAFTKLYNTKFPKNEAKFS